LQKEQGINGDVALFILDGKRGDEGWVKVGKNRGEEQR
jgi:hypothetical protein